MIARIVAAAALVACDAPGPRHAPPFTTDSGIDAYVDPWIAQPFAMSGYTPIGPSDNLHFIRARYLGQGCGLAYEIQILPAINPYVDPSPQMFVTFGYPSDATEPQVGTFVANVMMADYANVYASTSLTLTADRVDPPSAIEPHIVGRFGSSDSDWSLDFRVDVVSQFMTVGCDI